MNLTQDQINHLIKILTERIEQDRELLEPGNSDGSIRTEAEQDLIRTKELLDLYQ